jgi:hypothetical protein
MMSIQKNNAAVRTVPPLCALRTGNLVLHLFLGGGRHEKRSPTVRVRLLKNLTFWGSAAITFVLLYWLSGWLVEHFITEGGALCAALVRTPTVRQIMLY